MKNVNALLKKEQQAKDILANIGREKEDLAIKKLAEVKEILAALDCSYLLETTTERIVERTISINKGTVVKVKVEDTTKIEKLLNENKALKAQMSKMQLKSEIDAGVKVLNNEIDKHKQTIAEQNKEIEKLKKTIATMQRNATAIKEEQDSEIKDAVKEVLSNRTKAKKESVIDMINNAPDVEDVAIEIDILNQSEEEDYMAFLASQEESIMSEINCSEQQEIVEEPVGEDIKEETIENKGVDAPQFVKVSNSKVGKNPNAKLYQTEKCYLIASPTTDEITWLSHEELSDEYKIAVENMLVNEHKFLTNRTKLSPVKINRDNGYMARSSAVNGVTEFSMKDVLVGYVKLDNKFYLYSYCPRFARPNVDSLDAIIAKQKKTMPDMSIITKVTAVVIDMYKEYKALIDANKKEADKKAEENAKSFNEKVESRRAQREADEALIAKGGLLDKIKKNRKKVVSSATDFLSSSMLDDVEDKLF